MNKNRNSAKIRLKTTTTTTTTTTTNNARLISIIQLCLHSVNTRCQNAACCYELFPLKGGLCFGEKRLDCANVIFLLLTVTTVKPLVY